MNPSPASSVADRVRKRIRVAEISQEELGRQLGLSQPAISRRMTGGHPWRIDELEKLAQILGVPLADLVETAPYQPAEQPTGRAS